MFPSLRSGTDARQAVDLLAAGPSGVGYLLNEHVADARRFAAVCGCRHRRHDA